MTKKSKIMRRGYRSWKIAETSKLILCISYLLAIILTVITVIGAFTDKSMEYVVQIALASYGEVAAANIWYFKKAARENIFKNIPKEYLEGIDLNNLI